MPSIPNIVDDTEDFLSQVNDIKNIPDEVVSSNF